MREHVPLKREPYSGPVIDLDAAMKSMNVGQTNRNAEDDQKMGALSDPFHQRPPTSSGGRNMQDSSFALSGKQS